MPFVLSRRNQNIRILQENSLARHLGKCKKSFGKEGSPRRSSPTATRRTRMHPEGSCGHARLGGGRRGNGAGTHRAQGGQTSRGGGAGGGGDGRGRVVPPQRDPRGCGATIRGRGEGGANRRARHGQHAPRLLRPRAAAPSLPLLTPFFFPTRELRSPLSRAHCRRPPCARSSMPAPRPRARPREPPPPPPPPFASPFSSSSATQRTHMHLKPEISWSKIISNTLVEAWDRLE